MRSWYFTSTTSIGAISMAITSFLQAGGKNVLGQPLGQVPIWNRLLGQERLDGRHQPASGVEVELACFRGRITGFLFGHVKHPADHLVQAVRQAYGPPLRALVGPLASL